MSQERSLREIVKLTTIFKSRQAAEIYIENSGFLAQIPGAQMGFSKSPNGRWGSGENPDQKPEFCTYFFLTPHTLRQYEYYCYHTYFAPLKNFKKETRNILKAEDFRKSPALRISGREFSHTNPLEMALSSYKKYMGKFPKKPEYLTYFAIFFL